MQIAVISDIHGNCYTLDQVLKDIRRQDIEQIVCLGDALQGGAQPAETLQRLRDLNCPVVMGNADAWLITGEETSPNEQVSERQEMIRDWSLNQLSREDIAFIQRFQPTIEVSLEDGKKMLCFHGSPRSFDDVILPDTTDDTVRQFLQGFDMALLTGGHTHTQQMRRIDQRWYFNPGSVSLAYNWELSDIEKGRIRVDPWSHYAIVSSEGACLGITFRHVPYDVDELARIIRASGVPYAEEAIAIYQ
ncbi:DNA methylase [Dictyobacter sp. S3.2.2.5]|uniref:DNA methylase n=1 Tax=Dictyobacter halimunensis TaxID=3026934 RepID=A0ABQ6FLI4_9CHLR|nr:DNA methylase [Dictyobacter sp. S3.2.2.5]